MKYVALVTLGCFCTIVAFGYGRAYQWSPHGTHGHAAAPVELRPAFGYDLAEVAAANELVERAIKNAKSAQPVPASDTGYGACALREKFGLKPCGKRS